MAIPFTINHEIQKMLKERNHYKGEIDGIINDDVLAGIEHLFFEMGINYAGWKTDRKLIAAEEVFYETQGIDVGVVDGLNDHYIQHAREVYNAKKIGTWRDTAEEIIRENSPPDTSGSPWAAKYTLTQKALGITAEQYDAYREAVGYIESRNNPNQGAGGAGGHYWGMYQFGTAATETTSAFLKDSISKEDFEGNQDLAEKHFDALSYLNHKALSKSEEYNKLSPSKKLAVLGYSHNQGAGGARKWLVSGEEGFDGFGTSGKKYYDAILKALKSTNDASPKEDVEVKKPEKAPKTVEVSKEKFGVGIIKGKKSIPDSKNESRPSYMSGNIVFEGFKDSSINKVTFDAGSGGRDSYPSVPFGTYILTPQGVGSIIANYYENNGLDPSEGAFRTVYNVGRPGDITGTGYDPKVDRNRGQIQIHSNVRHDKNRLVSSGCLTVTPDDFPSLISTLKKASEETDGQIALVVEPSADNDDEATFKIVPVSVAIGSEEVEKEVSIPDPVPVEKESEKPDPVIEEETEKPEVVEETTEIQTDDVIFIGDSVAYGLLYANSPDGKTPDGQFVEVGIGPAKLLKKIEAISPSKLEGKTVILSAGLLNNPKAVVDAEQIVMTLKDRKANVVLVGGPKEDKARDDLKSVNSSLEQIAMNAEIPFLGPYDSRDGVHPISYPKYDISKGLVVKRKVVPAPSPESKIEVETPAPPAVTAPVDHTPKKKTFSLRDIDIHQLKFIRGIGQTESGYSKAEAYSEAYNQESNNRNVRSYGQKGADYGYYQCNELDVEHAIRVGVHPEIAKHLNGGGKDGKSSVSHQTIAMHEYIRRVYKDSYEALKSGKDSALEEAIDAMDGKWFGLKDRPEEARKIWKSDVTVEELFPEVQFSSLTEAKPPVKIEPVKPIIVPPSKKVNFNWPKQSSCEDFYGQVGTNQVKCEMPFPLVIAWDKGTRINSYSCHKLVKDPMERIWNRTFDYYGIEKIRSLGLDRFGGCLNVRKMRGGSSWSMHAWGIAVDVDPERNAFQTSWADSQMSKPEYKKFVEFWYDEGAINLGKERDFDPMHFQFAYL